MKNPNSNEQFYSINYLDDLNARTEKQFAENNVTVAFSRKYAEMTEQNIFEYPCKNRRDLRDLDAFTIDCEDTKDMDDAVSLSFDQNARIFHLGVHIADVSSFITPGSELDQIAMERGTSIYLPHLTVPMLPPVLSNNLCSLNPGVDRNTISVLININVEGKLTGYRITKSKINSRIKGSYNDINRIIKGSASPDLMAKYSGLLDSIMNMNKLAQILRENRRKAGATLNSTKPASIRISDHRIELVPYTIGPAENLIEEFMVLANNTVANFFKENHLPTIYRVQDVKNTLAKYQPLECHHAELALECYAHFTSPIRRLADLRVHQVLSAFLSGCTDNDALHYIFDEYLNESCLYANKRSRRADNIEYFLEKACYSFYFESHKHNSYFGIVIHGNKSGKPMILLDNLNICVLTDPSSRMKPGQKVKTKVNVVGNNLYAYNTIAA